MKKRTFNELGPKSWYQYDIQDVDKFKKMIISNTISSLNVVSGDTNGISYMIESVNNIGSNVKELEASCFYGCPNLKRINLGKNIKKIKDSAFQNCTKLSSFDDNIFYMTKKIGQYVFDNCNFETIHIKRNDISTDIYEENDYDEMQLVPNSTFSNNGNLISVYMDDVYLYENMFNNCSSLNNVSFSYNAKIINTGSEVFNNCQSLEEITMPSTATNYFNFNGNFLKGSNINEINLPGFSNDEVDVACGKIEKELLVPLPPTDEIKLGTIYFFKLSYDMGNLYDEEKQRLDKLIENAVKYHIPVINIQYYDENFLNNVIFTDEFLNFFKQKKCIIILRNLLLVKRDTKDEKGGFDDYQYYSGISHSASINIEYTTNENKTLGYEICNYSKFGKKNIIRTAKLNDESVIKLEQSFNLPYVQILNQNGNITLQFLGENGEYKKVESNLIPISPPYHNSDNYEKAEFTAWWRTIQDVTISPRLILFTEEQKNAFLNGESFVIEYQGYHSKMQFHFSSTYVISSTTWNLKINEKTITYYVKMGPLQRKTTPPVNPFNLFIESNNIYFVAANGEEKITDFKSDTVENLKKTINTICTDYLKCNDINYVEQGNTETEKIKFIGNCWGVEHDCTAIDKDGNPHYYTYTPPSQP